MILFSLDLTSSPNYTFLEKKKKKRNQAMFLLTKSRTYSILYHEKWNNLNINNTLKEVYGFTGDRFNTGELL